MIKTRSRSFLYFLYTMACYSLFHTMFFYADNETPAQYFDIEMPKPIENKSRKIRMRKPKHKEKKRKIQTYMDMTYEELVIAKDKQKAQGTIPATIKYLEQLMKLTTDIGQLADHLLEIADLMFIDKQFKKAAQLYAQYCALYPGNEKQEYAFYRSIMSSFKCILSVDRDQSKTEETLALTNIFLQQEYFTTYKNEVLSIQKQCYQQLFESEYNICKFYIQYGKKMAAEKRIKNMRSTWIDTIPESNDLILVLENQLNEQEQKSLLKKNPLTQVAYTISKHMADRF